MSLVFSKDFLYVSAGRDYGDEDESINEKEAYPMISLFSWCDPLAQLVEHNTFNVGVLGSSPKRITS